MSENIIEVKNLYYKYADQTQALSDVNLKVPKGKKVAIIGSNGAGKTTLFLHFNGIHKPSKGDVLFNGEKLEYKKKPLKTLRNRVGIVFQDPNTQVFSASVFQEIAFAPMNHGLGKEAVKATVERVLGMLNIQNLRDKPTHYLSGGEKKKVAIASVLSMDPEVLIFDEPLANVDPRGSKEILNIMDRLNEEGKTIIVSTHDLNSIQFWADYIYVLHEGCILHQGTPEDIFSNTAVLEEANLVKPWFYEVYEALLKNNPGLADMRMPEDSDQLFAFLSQLNVTEK